MTCVVRGMPIVREVKDGVRTGFGTKYRTLIFLCRNNRTLVDDRSMGTPCGITEMCSVHLLNASRASSRSVPCRSTTYSPPSPPSIRSRSSGLHSPGVLMECIKSAPQSSATRACLRSPVSAHSMPPSFSLISYRKWSSTWAVGT